MQLLLAVLHAHAIAGVDDPHKCVGLLEVVTPVWAEGALATDIPYVQSTRSASRFRSISGDNTYICLVCI